MTNRSDEWRTLFHIMPPVGWLNDPNGLCQLNGIYHVFFQNRPDSADGSGRVYWGHYESEDLLHWSFRGNAIAPDSQYDSNGAYSGSALIEDGIMKLYYTGNVKEAGDYDYIYQGRQANTLLVTSKDGDLFSDKICLMTNADYPDDLSCHIRDPKVWKEQNQYYMIQGARTKKDVGEAIVFSSKDGLDWKYEKTICTKNKFGYMWECPDLFQLDEMKILSICPQGVEQSGLDYANIYQAGYYLMNDDDELSDFTEWDRGFDFYAPQTFVDEKGRRLMIAWMGMPDAEEHVNPTVQYGWQHALTFPRELYVRDVAGRKRVCQRPIEELALLRTAEQDIANGRFYTSETAFDAVVENKTGADWEFTMNDQFRASYDSRQKVFTITYCMDTESREWNQVQCDSAYSAEQKWNMGCGRRERAVKIDKVVKCEIIYDVSCLEIFLNDGEEVFSTRIYPCSEVKVTFAGEDIAGKIWSLGGLVK